MKKDIYGYQQGVKKYSWSILIINNVLYSGKRPLKYFAVACSYLMLRLSLVSGDE
jgi:hypothetical protein